MTYQIKQGESKAVDIALYEDNVAVSLSGATDVICVLYVKQVAGPKFSLNTKVGYGTLTVGSAPDDNVLTIQLTREQTQAMEIGLLYASVVAKWNDIILINGLVKEWVNTNIGSITYGNFVKDEVLS